MIAPAVPETAGRSEHNQIRSIEIGSIQQIENLGAKLQAQAFVNRCLFQRREVPGRKARTDQCVSPKIAVKSAVGRRREKRVWIKPLIGIAQNHRPGEIRIGETAAPDCACLRYSPGYS